MKKTIFLILFIAFALSACVPKTPSKDAIVISTEAPETLPAEMTAVAPTNTLVPTLTPSMTPTPLPESISDSVFFFNWLIEFANANNGTVTVGGQELNALQLLDEIQNNSENFIETRLINGEEVEFLLVNGIPLAFRNESGQWQEATIKNLGTMVNLKMGSLISNDEGLRSWWGSEYHMGTVTLGLSDDMKDKTTIDFGWPRYQAEIARENLLETKFHAVLFPGDAPSWVYDGFTQEELDNLVRMVVKFAKSQQMDEIVVVNEARTPASWVNHDMYWEKLGIEYVISAFTIAREVYPEAKLIYNDTANHKEGTYATETTHLISNALFERGLIDYVGVQMHVESNQYPNKDEMISVFRSYPVPVVITEFDVLLTDVPKDKRDETLNEVTRTVIEGCIESEVCLSITWWGENDRVGWTGRSLLRDMNNKRKQAYYVAMQTMFEYLPSAY
ncbi:MAG: hypothetical protein HN392_00435 [Anaerolineae bacterium]|jgi:GH35 family endo-1,4-beta-xylanase|nr:hypothetical protein [Anaerolineae bacterium]MBT7073513.1 hypothetical protein [Anaerolineae bacterium]